MRDEVGQVVEQAVDRFGRIDSYIANAIVTVYAETYRYEPDELHRILDVNLRPDLRRRLAGAAARSAAGSAELLGARGRRSIRVG